MSRQKEELTSWWRCSQHTWESVPDSPTCREREEEANQISAINQSR